MNNKFKPGDKKIHHYVVKPEDVAQFDSGLVHPVCSTFTLAREMEWSSRLFVLEMKEDHEEGIGTEVSVKHHSPAKVGEELLFTAEIASIQENELICQVTVNCQGRLIAIGITGQKILSKQKIKKIFSSLEEDGSKG